MSAIEMAQNALTRAEMWLRIAAPTTGDERDRHLSGASLALRDVRRLSATLPLRQAAGVDRECEYLESERSRIEGEK